MYLVSPVPNWVRVIYFFSKPCDNFRWGPLYSLTLKEKIHLHWSLSSQETHKASLWPSGSVLIRTHCSKYYKLFLNLCLKVQGVYILVFSVLPASYPTQAESTPLTDSNYCLVQASYQFCWFPFFSVQHHVMKNHQYKMEPYILSGLLQCPQLWWIYSQPARSN